MRRIVSILLFICGAVATVAAQEQFEVTRFEGKTITGVRSSGVFKIEIRQGEHTGAKVSVPERFKDWLVFTCSPDGKIVIGIEEPLEAGGKRIKKRRWEIRTENGEKFTAEITCSSLEDIDISGVCHLNAFGNFESSDLNMKLSGASKIVIKDGDVNVRGNVRMNFSGASEGKMQIVASGELHIEASGASKINLAGNASSSFFHLSGASRIQAGEFWTDTADAYMSGASTIGLSARKSLNVKASGTSSVTYTPVEELVVTQSISGASKVRSGGKSPEVWK